MWPRRTPGGLGPDDELRIFDQVVTYFDLHSLRWWLDQGSALGAVRDGHFLPWDHDIDISVSAQELEPLRTEFIRAMHRSGHRVKASDYAVQIAPPFRQAGRMVDVRLQTFDGDVARCSLRHPPPGSSPGAILRRNGRIPISALHRLVEWFARGASRLGGPGPIERMTDGAYAGIAHASSMIWRLRGRLMVRTDFAIDAAYFAAVEEVAVDGRLARVPADAERYLHFKYGPDWRTPKQDWIYWEDDGAVERTD